MNSLSIKELWLHYIILLGNMQIYRCFLNGIAVNKREANAFGDKIFAKLKHSSLSLAD